MTLVWLNVSFEVFVTIATVSKPFVASFVFTGVRSFTSVNPHMDC
jgi:hypothetical protein